MKKIQFFSTISTLLICISSFSQTGVCFTTPDDYSYATGSLPSCVLHADFNIDGLTDLVVVNNGSNNLTILLGNVTGTFSPAPNVAVGSSPKFATFSDFNGDGKKDLAIVNSTNISIVLGNGDGTFSSATNYPSGTNPFEIACADFNTDGKIDLAVSTYFSNIVCILIGNGSGGFSAPSNVIAGMNPNGITSADFNNDGKMDFAVVNGGTNNVSILIGTGTGTFAAAVNYGVGSGPGYIICDDFNGDGNVDLAVSVGGASKAAILIGTGTGTFAAAVSYNLPMQPNGLTSGDFNGDGIVDLALTANFVCVLIGTGTGTFVNPVRYAQGDGGGYITSADFNLDGKIDLAVDSYSDNKVSLLFGNGNGTFAAGAYGADDGAQSLAIGDFDMDGILDMAVANINSDNISIIIGNGNGTFLGAVNFAVANGPASIITKDFNADGKADIAIANQFGNFITAALGNGDGTFGSFALYGTGPIQPRSITSADFNADGKYDLAYANYAGGNVSVRMGSGTGTFGGVLSYTTGSWPSCVTTADFNADGKMDMAVTNQNSNNVSVLINTGTGTFAATVNYTVGTGPSNVAAKDVNADGKADLVVTNYGTNDVSILLNSGTGTFVTPVNYPSGTGPRSVTIADFNSDGKDDLAVAAYAISLGDVNLLLGNGDGTFISPQVFPAQNGPGLLIASADLNNDGSIDIASANYDNDGVTVLLNASANITAASTSFCAGSNTILNANTTGYAYSWSPGGETTNSIVVADSGTYNVVITNHSGTCISTSNNIVVAVLNDCDVWPGDTDNNSIANNYDLLPIGLYYSQTGILRDSISNLWQADSSANWGTTQTNGVDIKYVDCNGDGIINNNDTLAINLNFSLTHAFAPNNSNDSRAFDPNLYFVTSSSTYNPGDWVDVEVWAGNSTTPVNNLYGVAFNINYDASLVQPGTESLSYPFSWLGDPGTDAITIAKIDALANTAYGGITRIDHVNKDGFGKIADFKFQANTSISSPSVLHLSFSNYVANDSVGIPVLFNALNDSIFINPLGTTISAQNTSSGFNISPNPFTFETTISFSIEQKNTTIKIVDVLGKEIKTINFTGRQLVLEKGEMPGGIYFVQVIDENKAVVNKKIVVQ